MKYIYYNIAYSVNVGTEEEPKVEEKLTGKRIAYSEANLELAKEEACNGEYTIEDDGQPEPDTASTDDVLNALLGVSV